MTERTSILPRAWAAAFTAAVSVAALGAALGGCASPDYHCDNTACYYCDGVDCRPVTPDPRPTCRGDYECTNNTVCTSAGCVARCTMDSDCGARSGLVCRNNQCLAPSEMPPTMHPGDTCSPTQPCANGLVCVDGTCRPSTTPACTADTECTGGRVCITGRCVDPATVCRFNSECGSGRLCVNNACRQACGGALPACASGFECIVSGGLSYCQQRRSPLCTRDAECGSGTRCVNGSCYGVCNGGQPCAEGYYCDPDGICVTDTRPRPFCPTQPCDAGSVCVGGVCRIACDTSMSCAARDVTFRSCGRIPNRTETTTYCLTDHEYQPMCLRQAECASGQTCIDGRCY